MFLGNTFGFILDMMIGGDEGLREYLWSPQGGMKYALGSLASDRFGRYIITTMFDMVIQCTPNPNSNLHPIFPQPLPPTLTPTPRQPPVAVLHGYPLQARLLVPRADRRCRPEGLVPSDSSHLVYYLCASVSGRLLEERP